MTENRLNDFIASAALTADPYSTEIIFGRKVRVESTAEIVAKKVWHRGREFTARDIFDLALAAIREPGAIETIRPILRQRRDVIRARIAGSEKALRETFAGLDTLEFRPTYDECVKTVGDVLDRSRIGL